METPSQLVASLRDAKTLEDVQRCTASIIALSDSFADTSLSGAFFSSVVSTTRTAKKAKAEAAPDANGYVNAANSLLATAKTCACLSENQKKRIEEMLTELNSDNPLDRITPPEPRGEGERPKRRRERGKGKKTEGNTAGGDANAPLPPSTQESWNLVCANADSLATTLEGFTGFKFGPRTIGHLRAALLHDSAFQDLPELRARLADTEHMRLEFLGNSVLNSVSASYVFSQYKTSSAKQLENLRKGLSDPKAATSYATKLNLGHLVLLGQGAAAGDAGGKAAKKPTLADTFRPVLGALFASGGMNPCQTLFKKIVDAPAAPAGSAPAADGEGKRRNRRRGPKPAGEGDAAAPAEGESAPADGSAPRGRRPRRGRRPEGGESGAAATEPVA